MAYICSMPLSGGLIFGECQTGRGVGADFRMEIYVTKMFKFIFGRDTASENFFLCIQEYHMVKLSKHNDMKSYTVVK